MRASLLPALILALASCACGQTLSGGWNVNGGFTLSPGTASTELLAAEFGQDMNVRTHPWPNVEHDVEFGLFRLWDSNSVKWNVICPSTCTWTDLDAWLDWIEAHGGKKVLYTFGYDGSNPTLPTDWTKWDYFATQLAQHSAARKAGGHQGIDYYELWNEPNNSYWNYPNGVSVANLVTGMQHAYPLLKHYDPSAQVVSPSACYCLQGAPHIYTGQYLAEAQSRGDANYPFFDIQAYHSYLGTYSQSIKAEGVLSEITQMKNTMATYGISAKPLWNTEFSWEHTGSPSVGASGSDATYQVNFVARAHALYIASGVRMTWYGWDFGGESWGTMWDSTNGVHPSGYAYDRIVHWLSGATGIGALSTTSLGSGNYLYTLNFTSAAGTPSQLVWTKTGPSTYSVPSQFQGHTYYVIDGSSGTAGATLSAGEAMVLISE